MAICCVSESLRLILGEGFSVAIFEFNGFFGLLVVWVKVGGADQMVGCRSDVGYYLGGGSMREREK